MVTNKSASTENAQRFNMLFLFARLFLFKRKRSEYSMATKKVKTILKLNLKAGEANPAPPVGPALGQHGVNIMDFCKAYNEATQDKKGQIIPAEITVYEDRSFTFVTKLAPVSALIKRKLKIQKGAHKTGTETVATITREQAEEIAREKMQDLNTEDLEAATKTVIGTARSMGVKVQ
jgi:large subunit ribosomal protein L11